MKNYITREELEGKSPGDIITLFLNRSNGTDFQKSQLDFIDSQQVEEESGELVFEVTVQPRRETGWTNGPLILKIPVIDVGDFYKDFEVKLVYQVVVSDRDKPAVLIRAAGGPPAKPMNIRIHEVGLGEPENPELRVSYLVDYDSAFFTGTLPLTITGAPNNMHSLKELNKRLLNTTDIH